MYTYVRICGSLSARLLILPRMKRHEYRDRVIKTLNFEQQIYKEFEQLCNEERIYPSQKLQELMLGELEKKVVGHQNPLNVSYGKQEKKPLQLDLNLWIDHVSTIQEQKELNHMKGMALEIARRADKRSMELYRNGIR